MFLIDGSSQMYRAYHAFRGKGLSNEEGQATHAVYVFVTMLRKLLLDHHPDYIAASFDLPGPTFRDALVGDYKANRAAMPADLAEQIAWVHEACEALGVPIVTSAGYEADDVIGTLARQAADRGYAVVVVSIDKDFFQLVGDNVRVLDPREDGAWFDAPAVVNKFGVPPAQVVDVLALVGDASDNVAGVPGIGKKGAVDLMARYGSLDGLLEHLPDLKPKQREALSSHREIALRSRELVTIRTDVPVALEEEAIRYLGPSRERCFALFSKLGFTALTNEFAPTAQHVSRHYALVRDESGLAELVAELRRAGRFAFRVFADRPGPMGAGVIGVSFSTSAQWARYVPVGHDDGSGVDDLLTAASAPRQLRLSVVLDTVGPLFEDAGIAKVAHDIKADTVVLAEHGVSVAGLAFDTVLASYVLNATHLGGHSIEALALEHLSYRAQTEQEVCGKGVKAVSLRQVAPAAMLDYAGERADLVIQLASRLERDLTDAHLTAIYQELELPLVPVLAAIERAGVLVDRDALEVQSRQLEQALGDTSARIFALAGEVFNINSPKQLGDILFDKLKLPALKKTGKTRSASTSVEVLEELALSHELPQLILDWRGLHKLKSTYIDALPLLVNRKTGRVHTSFNQAVAATGRLSSSDPNLQNIPIRSELGREIRRAFVAPPGHVLISADYSQIELRVLAHLADEDTLIEAFRAGADIHDRTAAKVFGAASALDPHELRRRAKIINYALLYGKTAFTLSKDIGVSKESAQDFIDAYFAGFPKVRAFIDSTLQEAKRTGVVKTLAGRRRFVPDLNSSNGQMRARAEREAVNMPIQGTAADILKRAMIDVDQALRTHRMRTRMILTVHDELLFESPHEEAGPAADLVRQMMEGAAQLRVPLTVDVGAADNWRDAKG